MAMISSVSSILKKTLNPTQVSTPEETKERKKRMLGIVDSALDNFKNNLDAGRVVLDSSLDLERLVKCALVLSGEPDTITGKSSNQSEEHQIVDASKINEILDENDPMVKSLFDKLYKGYNKLNYEAD